MTPQQHVTRVRQIALQLRRADYGLGMPRDYQLVLALRSHLEQAGGEAVAAIHDAFVHGQMKRHEAIEALLDIGEDEAERVVDEWADLAEQTDPENIYGSASMRQSIEEDRK
jgi:hypothetical protein